MQLQIAVVLNPPFAYDACFSANGTFNYSCPMPGLGIDITLEICKQLKLDCIFLLGLDSNYGVYDSTSNTWSGVLGMIYNGTVDTSIPLFSPTNTRLADFSFTQPVYNLEEGFYFRSSMQESNFRHLLKQLFPFKWDVAVLVSLSMIVLGTLITFIELRKAQHIYGNIYRSIIGSYTDVAGFLLNQAADFAYASKTATRFLVVSWTLSSLVLINLYSGTLMANLIASRPELPFSDVETLATCLKELRCKLILTTLQQAKFQQLRFVQGNRSDPLAILLRSLGKHTPIVESNKSKIAEVIVHETNVHYVYWGYQASAQTIQSSQPCDIFMLPDDSGFEIAAYPFRKGSHVLEHFDRLITQYRENGILRHYYTRYVHPENIDMCQHRKVEPKPSDQVVKTKYMFGPALLLSIGFVVAVMVLLFEFLQHCATRNQQ